MKRKFHIIKKILQNKTFFIYIIYLKLLSFFHFINFFLYIDFDFFYSCIKKIILKSKKKKKKIREKEKRRVNNKNANSWLFACCSVWSIGDQERSAGARFRADHWSHGWQLLESFPQTGQQLLLYERSGGQLPESSGELQQWHNHGVQCDH